MSLRLGVYGGSFDPPHVAHVGATRLVLGRGWVDRVLVVPVFEHAFHKDMTPFELRLELCRLAFADQPGVTVSDVERELPRPNFTVRLLEKLRENWPGAELRLIVGGDVVADFPRWQQSARVAELAPLLVLGRHGFAVDGAATPELPDVSSTELRRALASAADGELSSLVPPTVLARIRELHLYS